MADILDLLTNPDEPSAEEQAHALLSALNRQKAVGMLAKMTGNDSMGELGNSLIGDATPQIKQVLGMPEARSQLKGQALQQAMSALQQKKMSTEMAEDEGPASPLYAQVAKTMGYEMPPGLTNRQAKEQLALAEKQWQAKYAKDALLQSKRDGAASKEEQKVNQDFEKFEKELNPALASSRSGLGDVYKRYTGGQRLRALIADPGNLARNLTAPENAEAATALQAIISPGGHSAHEVENLIGKSAVGNLMNVVSFLSNEPMGQKQQAFTQRMIANLDREDATNAPLLHKAQAQTVGGYAHLAGKDKQRFLRILVNAGLDPKEFDDNWVYKPLPAKPAAATPNTVDAPTKHHDAKAVNWARKTLEKDPTNARALKILELNGEK